MGGRGTLSLNAFIPRVAGDAGTITLRCKVLWVLQLDIEGVDATLDAAGSLEVRRGAPAALALSLPRKDGSEKGLLSKSVQQPVLPRTQLMAREPGWSGAPGETGAADPRGWKVWVGWSHLSQIP